jgi:5-amino-6-(5-phospho-D-ribitylamino)uracil phosphatase
LGNPEVSGSNPLPATKSKPESDRLWFFVNPNDLSMFNIAGYSIAMGNAPSWVKDRACEATDTNDQSGLVTALEKIFGIIYR